MNKFLKLTFLGASVLVLGSCKKFVDVNTNPNNAVITKAQYVFSGALANTYRNQVSSIMHMVPGTWAGHYAHSTSFTGGGAEKTYEFTNADFNVFDAMFNNLFDYEYVKNNAARDGVSFWKDPADVMQCYVYQQIVDLYGDVPYREAFQGTAKITPKYDSARTIYEDLVVRLDSAMARMTRTTWPTAADVTIQDVYFSGNKTEWIRFANTVKLRILMRQSFMPGRDAYISSNINNTIANGYISANVQVMAGAGQSYQNIAGKLNPYYEVHGFNNLNVVQSNYQYRKMNAALVNWLKTSVTTNQPATNGNVAPTANADVFRLQALVYPVGTEPLAASNDLTQYVGIPMGIGSGYATATSSPAGPFIIQKGFGTRPGYLMLLAERFLLQAEAAERYGITFGSSAQGLYESGVRSHFRTLAGYTATPNPGNAANAGDAAATAYLAMPLENISYTASTSKIRAILVQKWVSLVHISGLEAWSDYRKSNGSLTTVSTPILPRTNAATTNPEPVRFLYPQTEIDANGNNVPKNINRFTSRLFWDVN